MWLRQWRLPFGWCCVCRNLKLAVWQCADADLGSFTVRPEAVKSYDRPAAARPKGMQLGKAKKAADMLDAMAKVGSRMNIS